ncbi:pseudouridine synthase [Vitreoscilla sp. C1]|uniref:RluA family pseudouridine synthase n=1 Tax=Vitreoscilla sp. (strain C1) TaxID=96942 RepID=UPI00148E9854|nr:RluA family pseudouridine synthase [Vitreoscilla sp. C1]AUZ03911.2 pseudouridine synthase [Vitreoscilla sp. C1]
MVSISKDLVNFLTIGDEDAGQRLDNFLIKILKGVPKSHIQRIIRAGEVRVNKKRAQATTRLVDSDVVRIPPVRIAVKNDTSNQKSIPAKEFEIVYEDDWLLVINKPSGVAVHGGSGVNFGVIEQMRQARPEARYLELVHRLDKDTSGLLMIAKKRSCLVKLHELLRDHHPYKSYIALGMGLWPDKIRHVKEPLFKYTGAQGEKMVRVSADGQFAHTVFDVLKTFALPQNMGQASLMRAVLKTGRTHQIRVHMQSQGCPIAADERYGDYDANRQLQKLGLKRMFLHAHQLKFTHPMTDEPLHLLAPLPKPLKQFLETLSNEQTVSSLNL